MLPHCQIQHNFLSFPAGRKMTRANFRWTCGTMRVCKATDLQWECKKHFSQPVFLKNEISVICSKKLLLARWTKWTSQGGDGTRANMNELCNFPIITSLCLCPQSLNNSRPSPRFTYDPSIFAFHSLSTGPPCSVLTQPEDPSSS